MQLLDITLDTLLNNPNIKHILIGNIWHFKHIDMNKVYDNNFKYVNVILVKTEVDGKKKIEKYISFLEIDDHVEFIRKYKSFEDSIDKALGLK